jgi:hypothetical protein
MSVSSISATSGSMAAAVAVAQSQALQYAGYFRELVTAVESADLDGARQALTGLSRISPMAAANGFDPLNQTPSFSRDFVGIRKALLKGDIRAAQSSLSSLKKEMEWVFGGRREEQVSVPPTSNPPVEGLRAEQPAVSLEAGEFSRGDANGVREDRGASVSGTAQAAAEMVGTSIQIDPALASFKQAPRVFPTSSASTLQPAVSTSRQLAAQVFTAMQPEALDSVPHGTAFAPDPGMMLGSRGMSIPEGALLELKRGQILPPTFAFSR